MASGLLHSLLDVVVRGRLPVLAFRSDLMRADPLCTGGFDLQRLGRLLEAVRSLCKVVPLGQAVTDMRAGMLPPRAACITFDGGDPEWLSGVVPLLLRLDMHATFFVAAGQFQGPPTWRDRVRHAIAHARMGMATLDLGSHFPTALPMRGVGARRQAVQRLIAHLQCLALEERAQMLVVLEDACGAPPLEAPVMPLEALRAIRAAGFGIGCLAASNLTLTRCAPDEAVREIAQGRDDLQSVLGDRVDGFSYPGGIAGRDFTAQHVEMVRRAGYRFAVTSEPGTMRDGQSVFQIPRFMPKEASRLRTAWQLVRHARRPVQMVDDGASVGRRALMIAFHFPPQSGSSGVLRTLNFVKHLPAHRWQADVLTARARAYEEIRSELVAFVPTDTRIVRAASLDAARHLSVRKKYPLALALPDRWSSWWLPAVWRGLLHMRARHVDLLWSTYPIATAHLIGASLALLTRKPWVADFRDPMINGDHPPEPARRWLWRRLEAHAMKRADACVFTTDGAAAVARTAYPHAAAKCLVVENGYDEDAFAGVVARRDEYAQGKLLLLHSGLACPPDRDPSALFSALSALLNEGLLRRDEVLMRFRAPVHHREIQSIAERYGVADVVEVADAVSHQDAIAEMLGADLLVLLQGDVFDTQIPAKAYEYLRAQRPILACVSRAGSLARLMGEFSQIYCAQIDSAAEHQAALRRWIGHRDDRRQVQDFSFNMTQLRRYARASQAQALARHFDHLVNGRTMT